MRLIVELLRAAAALLVAPAVAATLFAGFEWISNPGWPGIDPGDVTFLWPVAFIVALAHAVMLGLPAYLLLRWMRLTRWWVSLAGGFAIGALPYAIYFSPLREISSHSEVGRYVLVDNGVTTLVGWIYYGATAGALGLLGAAGGLGAWLTWYWMGRVFTGGGSAARDLPS